jgi:hypothetical protein
MDSLSDTDTRLCVTHFFVTHKESFHLVILLARIDTRIQALLRQGLGILSGKGKVKSENLTVTDQLQIGFISAPILTKFRQTHRSLALFLKCIKTKLHISFTTRNAPSFLPIAQ